MTIDTTLTEDASALDRLAAHFGIALEFEDAFGRPFITSTPTRKHLLKSMGVSAADEGEAAAALAAVHAADAARVLPPVLVLRPDGGACTVDLNVPAATSMVHWQVLLEDGTTLKGAAAPQVSADGDPVRLTLPDLPFGYHRLMLPELGAETALIVSPGVCWLPPEGETRNWGISVQLYLLRSDHNWGIGDFSDLARLVELASARGCAVLGLNPLHQMFLDDPEQASPYSPATRLLLNPLYIDVAAVPEFAQSDAARAIVRSARFQATLTAARASHLVDYSAVTALKLEALQEAFATFTGAGSEARRREFAAFCAEKGESLERASLFQVLRQHFADEPEGRDWRNWPAELQDVSSGNAHRFAEEHRDEIVFQNWLQFLADEQLGRASDAAKRAGMPIGLYRDLAVGCAADGAETWVNPEAFLQRTLVGAPPDIFNPAGQNWGLPPFDPAALKTEGYRSFAELIRANMRHAGGLRIDHVMGLTRLYCIPEGVSAADGAYVTYPVDDLIAVLAIESQRQQCLVVGEDLGTVPPGFRPKLAAANILSYRVLFFEQDHRTGIFALPADYPHLALAVTGSHDLPTLPAWWLAKDLEIKERLGLYPTAEETASQHVRRNRDKRTILEAFVGAGLLPEMPSVDSITPAEFTALAHAFLALTPSTLLATQFDDLTGDTEPVNIPGTSTENPNWRRKYRLSLEDLAANESAWSLIEPLAGGSKRPAEAARVVAGRNGPPSNAVERQDA